MLSKTETSVFRKTPPSALILQARASSAPRRPPASPGPPAGGSVGVGVQPRGPLLATAPPAGRRWPRPQGEEQTLRRAGNPAAEPLRARPEAAGAGRASLLFCIFMRPGARARQPTRAVARGSLLSEEVSHPAQEALADSGVGGAGEAGSRRRQPLSPWGEAGTRRGVGAEGLRLGGEAAAAGRLPPVGPGTSAAGSLLRLSGVPLARGGRGGDEAPQDGLSLSPPCPRFAV
ncbi:Eukaryotic Translation Initiation Factor 4 Gamma 2 [Manis pentadactyla]|nr:Eukaryotic Translation Initiation Factor 4 Gamma 2 [Manis pentadactyla]